jgi:hypothetical protein
MLILVPTVVTAMVAVFYSSFNLSNVAHLNFPTELSLDGRENDKGEREGDKCTKGIKERKKGEGREKVRHERNYFPMKTKQRSALKYRGRVTESILYKKRRNFVLNFFTVVA